MSRDDPSALAAALRQSDQLPALSPRPVAPGAVGYTGWRRTESGLMDRSIILYPQRDGLAALPWSWHI